jgi:predicted O-methyltransferase YrrM
MDVQLPSNAILREACQDGTVEHPDGHKIEVKANVNLYCCDGLYRFVRTHKPELAIEIGMAYGVSTLATLIAMEDVGNGRLISIDPYVGWDTGRDVALHQVQRAGLSHRHEHRRLCSYEALPALMSEHLVPQFVYIDGNHNFDYAFVDCFLADKLLPVGGVMAFNDAGWRSVFRVINFLRKYRRYRELDMGIPSNFAARNPLFSLIKRIEGRDSRDRYFEKLEDWEPSGDTMKIPGP